MSHPYSDLPETAFWRSGVAEADPAAPLGLYRPKFPLDREAGIATAGSCFAQHVGRALRDAGMTVLDAEPSPPKCPYPVARAYGYGIYSARYGNIYTVRQLVQLIEDARAGHVDPDAIWPRAGRFHDALRPTIEPDGFVSAEEVSALRLEHLAALRGLFAATSCFIFTLGLTECWADRQGGRVYPTCPGVVAGRFDPTRHAFLNLRHAEVLADLERARALLQGFNPGMRMILTVSPVPLTATAAGGHVLTATMRSKAVLRSAADEFAATHPDVDYFPAYEIVTNPAARGRFMHGNLRDVTAAGVQAVMSTFLSAHELAADDLAAQVRPRHPAAGRNAAEVAEDLICEEILLQAMRK
ncbi:GSCFA domain-containing protein [Paracoccus lutimaris]|uniref:GSCFA family protein n=1 Tax=Paracoccus lutimaris TaxID=1490030 RepID=A0A368YPB4_9RHOB|nr:GSCFA domain-containing protein [Paracoccus lutimaris]RCW82072.1 GSCFA family protein [Paracoccus lutimaris]